MNVRFHFYFGFEWEGHELVSGSLFVLGVGGSLVLKLFFLWVGVVLLGILRGLFFIKGIIFY